MTSELRPAVEVWAKAHAAYQSSVNLTAQKTADFGDWRWKTARKGFNGMASGVQTSDAQNRRTL